MEQKKQDSIKNTWNEVNELMKEYSTKRINHSVAENELKEIKSKIIRLLWKENLSKYDKKIYDIEQVDSEYIQQINELMKEYSTKKINHSISENELKEIKSKIIRLLWKENLSKYDKKIYDIEQVDSEYIQQINELMKEYSAKRINYSISESELKNMKNRIICLLWDENLGKYYKKIYNIEQVGSEYIQQIVIDRVLNTINNYQFGKEKTTEDKTLLGFVETDEGKFYLKESIANNGKTFFVLQNNYIKENPLFFKEIEEIQNHMKETQENLYYKLMYYSLQEDNQHIQEISPKNKVGFDKGYLLVVKSEDSKYHYYITTLKGKKVISEITEYQQILTSKKTTFPIFYAIEDGKVTGIGFSSRVNLKEPVTKYATYKTYFELHLREYIMAEIKKEVPEGNSLEEMQDLKIDSSKEAITPEVEVEIQMEKEIKINNFLLSLKNILDVYKNTLENSKGIDLRYKTNRQDKMDVFQKFFTEFIAYYFQSLREKISVYSPIDQSLKKHEKEIFEKSISLNFLDYFLQKKCRNFDELLRTSIKTKTELLKEDSDKEKVEKELLNAFIKIEKRPSKEDSKELKILNFPLDNAVYAYYYIKYIDLYLENATESEKRIQQRSKNSNRSPYTYLRDYISKRKTEYLKLIEGTKKQLQS